MKWRLFLLVMVLCLVSIGASTGQITTYSGLNAGIKLYTVGYEYRGHPGFFYCEGQC